MDLQQSVERLERETAVSNGSSSPHALARLGGCVAAWGEFGVIKARGFEVDSSTGKSIATLSNRGNDG